MMPSFASITTPDPLGRNGRSTAPVLATRCARVVLPGDELREAFAPSLIAMLTTAGVACLRTGASEETPPACAMTGNGTLAFAFTPAPATARPSSNAAKNCVLIGRPHFLGCGGRGLREAGPQASLE